MIWHNAIATRDNLIKRKWAGDSTCQFCIEQETISHLFFGCSAAKFVWSGLSPLPSTLPLALGVFRNFSGGSHSLSLRAATPR
jgi:hypothetical protein